VRRAPRGEGAQKRIHNKAGEGVPPGGFFFNYKIYLKIHCFILVQRKIEKNREREREREMSESELLQLQVWREELQTGNNNNHKKKKDKKP